jgi:hypothetical protein
MNWKVALAIPITFTGFLVLLEAIEDMLNYCEGGASGPLSRRSAPTLEARQQHPAVTTRVEWPLPWASLEMDYSKHLAHFDQSPRLVDRSHVAQLPFQGENIYNGEGAFCHLFTLS